MLSRALSEVVAGSLEFEFLQAGRDLISARVYDATLRDLDGRIVAEVRTLSCRFSPGGLFLRRIILNDCEADDGRLLFEALDGGGVGLFQAITGPHRPKANRRAPPVVTFLDMELRNIDVLVAAGDLMLRFDDVHLRNGRIEGGRGFLEIDGDARAYGGRVLANERLFALGDAKGSWEQILWDIFVANRPWAAANAVPPPPAEGRRGALDLRFDDITLERVRMKGEDIEIGRAHFEGPDVALSAAGLLRLAREEPKLAPVEQAIIAYEGQATVSIPSDSSLLAWAVPGLFDAESPGTFEPLVFTGYGTVRFFEGETRLRARDLRLGPFAIDGVDTGLSWRSGTMRMSDDTRVDAFGGVITGSGVMTSTDGLWSLSLCLDGVHLGTPVADLLGEDTGLAAALDARASTTPATCGPDLEPPIRLSGDLTLKAFERAPAATTPADKEVQPPMIEGTVSSVALRWDAPPHPLPHRTARLSGSASLTQRGLLSFGADGATPLTLRAGDDSVTFRGGIDTVTGALRRASLLVASRDVGRWLSEAGVRAAPERLRLDLAATLDGPFSAPDVQGGRLTVALDEASGDIPAGQVRADFTVRGDTLDVADLVVESTIGGARARGEIALFDGSLWNLHSDPELTMVAVVSALNVGAVAPDFGLDAELDATFGVTGSFGAPVVTGSRLELLDFRAFGEPIDYLSIDRYRAANDGVEAIGVLVIKGKGSITGDFRTDFDARTLEGQFAGRDFRLDEIRALLEQGVNASGDTDFDLRLGGTFDTPHVAGRLAATSLRVEGFDVGTLAATFHTFDGAVEIAAQAATDFDVSGRIPLDGTPWAFDVRFPRLPLDEHLRSIRGVFDRATVSGSVNLTLDPFGEGEHAGTLRLDTLDVRAGRRRFDIPRTATLVWQASPVETGLRHRLALADLSIGTLGNYLDIQGTLDVSLEESLVDLEVSGRTDFSLLRFLPDLIVDAEGLADVELSIRGPLDETVIAGELAFDRARIAPRGLGTSVRFGPGRLALVDGALRVPEEEPLTGNVFGGDFTAWGDIGLDGLIPRSVDYHVFVTNLAYRIPGVANVTLTSQDLHFQAPDLSVYDTWSIAGDVEIVDARYYEDIEVVGGTLSFGGFGRTVDAFALPIWTRVPAIGRMRADLTIHGRDRFLLDNTIASAEMDIEFRTDLELTGRFDAMVLLGELEALEGGTVTYRGREFAVEDMTLSFRGDRDERGFPMPVLDAELLAAIRPCVRRTTTSFDLEDTSRALAESEEVFITATLRGKLPYDLTFQLESTPFYDQRDQLSLILTGCTVDALTAGDAGGRTLEVVLAPVIDVVERSVEERLSLDTVDLVPATDGSAGILIQDDVSERFTWGLDATVGSATTGNRQVVRGEYRLFDWLMVEIQEQTSQSEAITVDTGLRFRIKLD